jgi:hypothetical protein
MIERKRSRQGRSPGSYAKYARQRNDGDRDEREGVRRKEKHTQQQQLAFSFSRGKLLGSIPSISKEIDRDEGRSMRRGRRGRRALLRAHVVSKADGSWPGREKARGLGVFDWERRRGRAERDPPTASLSLGAGSFQAEHWPRHDSFPRLLAAAGQAGGLRRRRFFVFACAAWDTHGPGMISAGGGK